MTSIQQVLMAIHQQLHIGHWPNLINPVKDIQETLVHSQWFHVFAFYKCETLRSAAIFIDFIDFLGELANISNFSILKTTVIFTTYKPFPSQSNLHTMEVCMLTDFSDIEKLLHFYSSSGEFIDKYGYIDVVIKNNLCFPLGVRHFAQFYLQGMSIPSPEEVQQHFQQNPMNFLYQCMHHRLEETEHWFEVDAHKWIVHLCQQHQGTFSNGEFIPIELFRKKQISSSSIS